MSDYDNLREDEYERKLEASNEARDAAIEFHADNWMTAVTQSVGKSNGSFPDVPDYTRSTTELRRPRRPANSVDVFCEELNNLDFMERAARILIDFKSGALPRYELDELFDDMAENYADYKYENSIKD